MKYYKATIHTIDGIKHYGDMSTYFVLGYEDKIANMAYFCLPEDLNLNFTELEEITKAEYDASIYSIIYNDSIERDQQETELLNKFQEQLVLNQRLKEQLLTADEKYKSLDLTIADLQTVKDAKMAQLEEACNSAIVSGFDYTINGVSYRFSCSLAAQANFQGADTLFKDNLITACDWTVENNQTKLTERITIDQATFNSLKLQVFQHINTNISKLRNTLQPLVDAALTNADVDNIKW